MLVVFVQMSICGLKVTCALTGLTSRNLLIVVAPGSARKALPSLAVNVSVSASLAPRTTGAAKWFYWTILFPQSMRMSDITYYTDVS